MAYFQGTFEDRCLTTGAPNYLSFFTTSFSILFFILNIPGNLLVILAVAFDPFKNLRTPFNYLMTNLAVADLIVGIVIDPMSAYVHWKEGIDAKITKQEIRTIHMSYFISCTASVLSLATLAVERYLAIRNPHSYRNKVTGKRILLTISFTWLISSTLPILYLKVGYITYTFIFANTAIIVAALITCFTYAMMLRTFRRRFAESTTTNETQPSERGPSNSTRTRMVQWQRKLTKMFMVVLIAFLCCYGPSTIFIYAMSFCASCSCKTLHWFRDLQFLFVIMNSSVNFYCYALRSPRFRNAFAYILRIRTRPTPELEVNSGSTALSQMESRARCQQNESSNCNQCFPAVNEGAST